MPTVSPSDPALPAPTHAHASTYASALAQELDISFADGIAAKKNWDVTVEGIKNSYEESQAIKSQLDLLGAKENSLEFSGLLQNSINGKELTRNQKDLLEEVQPILRELSFLYSSRGFLNRMIRVIQNKLEKSPMVYYQKTVDLPLRDSEDLLRNYVSKASTLAHPVLVARITNEDEERTRTRFEAIIDHLDASLWSLKDEYVKFVIGTGVNWPNRR